MGLRGFFHKIKIALTRMCAPSIPHCSEAEQYGEQGELALAKEIQARLPACRIKKNVLVQASEGHAEIDLLILYKNKLFAIEVKRWQGRITEQDDRFIQYKRDRWTEEIHTKVHKSPFKQIGRAIYLLRKENPENAWINSVVFFKEAERIDTTGTNLWFNDIDDLLSHIQNGGKPSWGRQAELFFDRCIAADHLYRQSRGQALHCIILDESLRFATPQGMLTRKDIRSISITHHPCYDELLIKTVSGRIFCVALENGSISVTVNGCRRSYALCKLDHIQLG